MRSFFELYQALFNQFCRQRKNVDFVILLYLDQCLFNVSFDVVYIFDTDRYT